ncbi:HAMP domain-containing histidine kinase [Pseudoduganella umbonata]|nr:HAMP domain-containing histidine kinase [Pseudoduganella umbonata]
MLAVRHLVVARWENHVRTALENASKLAHPILVNTIPAFYDNIAQSLTPNYPRATAVDGSTLASEHGGERARLTAYDHETLIREYQLLRKVIYDVMISEGIPLTRADILTIDAGIDTGIQEAVGAFAMVNNSLRERFAAALTHDLRGPLSATSSALELILMLNDLGKVKQLAAKALDSVWRMDGMITELLSTMAFHSGERLTLQLEQFDINAVIKEVQVGASVKGSNIVLASGSPIVGWWDRAALTRAVENLVSNALKYGRPRGPVTIRAAEFDERLQLSVHNEGDPIPVEEQECIFQMYRRTDNARRQQGWGIGLPYVRAVAESHGGSIVLDSHAERGTTLTIDIPLDGRAHGGAPTVA